MTKRSELEAVTCPRCGHEWVHMSSVDYLEGHDSYSANDYVRGDVVDISMWCETCRCHFHLYHGFHKGQVFAWTEYLTDAEEFPREPNVKLIGLKKP